VQFLTSITAHGDQAQLVSASGQKFTPGYLENFIDVIGTPPNQLGGGGAGAEALEQVRLMGLQTVAENLIQVGGTVTALLIPEL